MGDIAIRVSGLGKRYRVGERARYNRLTETLASLASASFRALRNGRPSAAARDFWALRNVGFEIKRGEAVGIIGRNGAGKSTLLKILSRITEMTEGEVDIFGRVGSLLEVGTGFHPELTGRENIFLNGAILGMTRPEIRGKFDEIVSFAEIEKFLETPVKRYSSGMYMRLAFAVAAHLDPEILVIDEVLAVGDVEFQKKCLGRMRELGQSGRTVLFVSHNMAAVEQLCVKAMILERGGIVAYGNDIQKIVGTYLSGTSNDSGSSWTNPGDELKNPWFFPLRFCLTDGAAQPISGPQRNNAEIWFEVEADVEAQDPSLLIGYSLFSEDGAQLFQSLHRDGPESRWPRVDKGRCVLRGPLPKRFLNEGTYRIELIGGLAYRQWLFQPLVNSPGVQLTIQGGLSDSPAWTLKRPGLLAPVLEWQGK